MHMPCSALLRGAFSPPPPPPPPYTHTLCPPQRLRPSRTETGGGAINGWRRRRLPRSLARHCGDGRRRHGQTPSPAIHFAVLLLLGTFGDASSSNCRWLGQGRHASHLRSSGSPCQFQQLRAGPARMCYLLPRVLSLCHTCTFAIICRIAPIHTCMRVHCRFAPLFAVVPALTLAAHLRAHGPRIDAWQSMQYGALHATNRCSRRCIAFNWPCSAAAICVCPASTVSVCALHACMRVPFAAVVCSPDSRPSLLNPPVAARLLLVLFVCVSVSLLRPLCQYRGPLGV